MKHPGILILTLLLLLGNQVMAASGISSQDKISPFEPPGGGKPDQVSDLVQKPLPPAGRPMGRGTVSVDSFLNFRSSPWGAVSGKLENGSKVDIIGSEGDWYKVSVNGKTGYVHKNYINTASPPESPKPPGGQDKLPATGKGGRITTKSPLFVKWLGEALGLSKYWKFPLAKNKFGKVITKEEFLNAIIFIESSGIHQMDNGSLHKSWAGAVGFAQLMPRTARGLGVDPANPRQNLWGASKYISEILRSPKVMAIGNPTEKLIMTIVGYNTGPYSKYMDRSWDNLKFSGPRETVLYGLKLKICLDLTLTDTEKKLLATNVPLKKTTPDEYIEKFRADFKRAYSRT